MSIDINVPEQVPITIDGEEFYVNIKPAGVVTKTFLAAKLDKSIVDESIDAEEELTAEEVIDNGETLLLHTTNLNRSQIEQLPVRAFDKLCQRSAEMLQDDDS